MGIEMKGLDGAIGRIDDLVQGLARVQQPMRAALEEHRDEMQGRAPVDTTNLQTSIEAVTETRGAETIGRIIVGALYGIFVEFPTRPHFVPARYIGEWAQRHGFGFTGLRVSGRAQPFVRRNEGETLRQVAERVTQTVKARVIEWLSR